MAKRILVVDDEPSMVELIAEALTAEGYRVDAAYDGRSALDLVREQIYDAAILDFNLPDMDGVMLHRQIRQMDQELAQNSLFTSGLVQTEDNVGYYSSQAAGFLAKPFEVRELLTALAALLESASDGPSDDQDAV